LLPVSPSVDGISLHKQTQSADCLAACAAMVLDFLGQSYPYGELLESLGIGPYGAPRRNILRLTALGLKVEYGEATPAILAARLENGQPIIAFVDTGELPYWSESTNHAVVVAGVDDKAVLVYDPALDAPQIVPREDFELAWLECDNVCALITR
jgi:ABC-type bacteriocin/lantibiotic exporter with double-glycine peptidase domain